MVLKVSYSHCTGIHVPLSVEGLRLMTVGVDALVILVIYIYSLIYRSHILSFVVAALIAWHGSYAGVSVRPAGQ